MFSPQITLATSVGYPSPIITYQLSLQLPTQRCDCRDCHGCRHVILSCITIQVENPRSGYRLQISWVQSSFLPFFSNSKPVASESVLNLYISPTLCIRRHTWCCAILDARVMEKEAQRQRDRTTSDTMEKSGMGSGKVLNISEEKTAPDHFDERYATTKTKIYAYYWCLGS